MAPIAHRPPQVRALWQEYPALHWRRQGPVARHEHADAPHSLGLLRLGASGQAAAPQSGVMNSRRRRQILWPFCAYEKKIAQPKP